MSVELSFLADAWRAGYLQDVDRAHTAGHQIEHRNGDQLPIQPVALVPGAEFLLVRLGVRGGAFQPGAQEALEVLALPFGDVLLVDGGLVLAEELEPG